MQTASWMRRHFLTVIFAVAYLMMSLLALEQGRTIANQRTLIRQLFSDSIELQAARMRMARTSHQ